MTPDLMTETSRVTALREAFDSSFTREPEVVSELSETLLAIRVGDAPYAIRLSQTLGIHVDKVITKLPGTPPEVLGVTGFRGTIATVFDLRVVLHIESSDAVRWLVLVSASPATGVAFDLFEGHIQCSPGDIASAPGHQIGGANLVDQAIRSADGVTRPIVNLSALVEVINKTDVTREQTYVD
jgi:chemotaxis signal transduction protein